jgi:hypothetical protein
MTSIRGSAYLATTTSQPNTHPRQFNMSEEEPKGLGVQLTEDTKAKISTLVTKKLAAVLGSEDGDENLLDYILLLIANNRSKKHVSTDLEVTLFELILRLSAASLTGPLA